MFVDEAKLKAAVKAGFKGSGITISRIEGWYHIFGDRFGLKIKADFLTNRVKGCIVEMCGEMPDSEEGISIRKGCEVQAALPLCLEEPEETDSIRRTRIIVQTDAGKAYRVWKGPDCIAVPESLSFLAEGGKLEVSETPPEGPFYAGGKILWKNNVAVLEVSATELPEEEAGLLEAVRTLDI